MINRQRAILASLVVLPATLVAAAVYQQQPEYGRVDGCFNTSMYFVEAEGGCKDTRTGLVWSKLGTDWNGVWSWSKWNERFRKVNHAGYTDWRMPTVAELKQLADNDEVVEHGEGLFPTLYHVPTFAIRTWSGESAKAKRYKTVDLKTKVVEDTTDGSWSPALAVRQGRR
jgi:hypothetical protein